MKRILFLIPLLFLLLSAVLTTSMVEAQKVSEDIKKIVSTSDENTEDEELSMNVKALEADDLKELSDTTKSALDEKKKDVSSAVVNSQKALLEKETVQNKVEEVEKELEETKTKMKEAGNQQSISDIHQLKEKSRQLEKEYQVLKSELKIKSDKAKKALEKSSNQQDEIDQLKEQLYHLEIEEKKRSSPRKKAIFLGGIILITLILLFAKNKLINLFENRLISRGEKNRSVRALRARTFLRIISWSISVLFIIVAIFFILELFGFDSTTTLAGAGIFGVAVGFGAQQFIKDIFSGLFLVLEGQYGINDFISVDEYSGNVEDINLRFTKLRNYDGSVVYVPNGDIHSVINYGKGYANSVIKFYVDVSQDVEQVFTLVREVVSELRSAPDLIDEIQGNVELLGINAFTPTGIEVKFRLKTAPQSQWLVGREVRFALKQRFDLENIKLFQYKYENQLER